ncbi:MAG: GIY-YIG nuclease family protein [Bacteroidota bacterium]|nr:GIY-YIG nuclease family protein [Bacteroidota bacterium]
MFFAYVIQSKIDGSLYKGHCEDLQKRLMKHNSGETKSIKSKIPFVFIYFEEFGTRAEAIKREKYFKTAAGRRFLKSKLPKL